VGLYTISSFPKSGLTSTYRRPGDWSHLASMIGK